MTRANIVNDSSVKKQLAQTSVFSHLDPGEIDTLFHSGSQRHYDSEEWVVHQGDTWPYLLYIIRGEIHALKESTEGRSLHLETIHGGEIFWGVAFFLDDSPMPAGLMAAQDCDLLVWSKDRLTPLINRNSRLSWELACAMMRRAQRASEIVEELAFFPVASRLANLLLEKYKGASGDTIARDLTLEEMAARIGTKREMVCRLLYRFAEVGLIQINRTEFVITDPEGLEAYTHKMKG